MSIYNYIPLITSGGQEKLSELLTSLAIYFATFYKSTQVK